MLRCICSWLYPQYEDFKNIYTIHDPFGYCFRDISLPNSSMPSIMAELLLEKFLRIQGDIWRCEYVTDHFTHLKVEDTRIIVVYA